MSKVPLMMRKLTPAAVCVITMLPVATSQAQQATEVQVTYSKGQFQPSELRAPADKPITFRVKNLDAKPMEFESKSLRVGHLDSATKQIGSNGQALDPGCYRLCHESNEKARQTG